MSEPLKIFHVDFDKFDPGEQTITEATGYKVVVAPESWSLPCWEFMILLPPNGNQDEDVQVVDAICQNVLSEKDQFSVYTISEEDSNWVQEGKPVLCYDPDDEESFNWLKMPEHMLH